MNLHYRENLTQKTNLRSVRFSDATFLCALENDPEVWQYSSPCNAPYTKHQIEQFCRDMERANGKPDNRGQLRLIIEIDVDVDGKIERAPIGTIDLYDCNEASSEAKIAIIIYPSSLRGRGYGKIAIAEALQFCKTIGIKNLVAEVDPQNEKSRNLFLGCGFHLLHTAPSGGVLQYLYND